MNVSMVESMLQFATPALLQHQIDPAVLLRHGNRHASLAPHGLYPCAGEDRWVAIAVGDNPAFANLARIIGRPDWIDDLALGTVEARKQREDEIDAVIVAWSAKQDPHRAAAMRKAPASPAPPRCIPRRLLRIRTSSPPTSSSTLCACIRGHNVRRVSRSARTESGLVRMHRRHSSVNTVGRCSRERRALATAYDKFVMDGIISFAPGSLRSAMPQSGEDRFPQQAKG